MADVDLRLLRYFVAVAEERNFTRAAERLVMTQGALSRAIRSLEAFVGTPLLVRGYREVTTTEAGQVLLRHARGLDEQTTEALRLARRAATATPRLTVVAGGWDVSILETLVSSYNFTNPGVPAEARMEGAADVALVRDPFDEDPGLDGDELFSEPRVVLLPNDHPLAARDRLELAQLDGSAVIRPGAGLEDRSALWPPEPAEPWAPGPAISDTCQIRAYVRLGQAITFVPRSIGTAMAGRGLRAIRVLDCPHSTMRIVWRRASTSRATAGFVRHAHNHIDDLTRSPSLHAL
ncbi:LysR family transcriptional regulator [Pseudonocardia acaciae]|uniref:LysR family transcriptional regulator n=1 Tax=Pseudonocardia acaciae TaxID=551276 RepID=UPI0007E8C611|nr:LysR family transcriptional regulator [Pseudonocardia acaciae]